MWDQADALWDGAGLTWTPGREVVRRAAIEGRTGEMLQVLIDGSLTERVKVYGWALDYQPLGREVQERHAGST